MGVPILITAGEVSVTAELADTENARKVAALLPLTRRVCTWGDEIYFTVPVACALDETAVPVVRKGDIGFWPTGSAFCLFFGPTPASGGEEIRPASAVNIIGAINGDCTVLRQVPEGSDMTITRKDG